MTNRSTSLSCQVCKRQMMIMKRCTRCRNVMYCSQDCQREDWPDHKLVCGKETYGEIHAAERSNRNDGSIFQEEPIAENAPAKIHTPLVDFSKALPKTDITDTKEKYLHNNEFYTDIPEISEPDQMCEVTMKFNKAKHKLQVQKTWNGNQLFKFIAYSLSIPLENIKLIHKGKVLTVDNVMETIQNKAVYQVVGEKAESEENIDQRDISIMMKQCGVDRNKAIQKLRCKGDLLDALLDQ